MSFKQRYERRFTGKIVEFTFWQSLSGFFRGNGWETQKYVFTEVRPEDKDYETAPYAESFVWHNVDI